MSSSSDSQSPMIHLSVPHMGVNEIRYVQAAFNDNWVSSVGPNLDRFEEMVSDRFGIPAVAVSSGTAAIHLALKLLGVGQGDEVVVPTLTFAGSCTPVCYENARPVFVDCGNASTNMCPIQLKALLEDRARANRLPKAIIVVHLFGESADMDPILSLANRYGIKVIEDAAEAVGSTYQGKHCGTMGDIGIFSFNGNKIITCSGGGMLLSKDSSLVEKAQHLATQARDPDPEGLGDYWHSEVGFNYRMSNVLAGVGCGQLEVLDERIEQRRAVALRYEEAFDTVPGITLIAEQGFGIHTRWLSCFLVDPELYGVSRNDLIRQLRERNIDSRAIWKPLHTQPAYSMFEVFGGENAEYFNTNGLCLPSSSSLSSIDQDRVIQVVKLLARSNFK